jgi:hypothetical protein
LISLSSRTVKIRAFPCLRRSLDAISDAPVQWATAGPMDDVNVRLVDAYIEGVITAHQSFHPECTRAGFEIRCQGYRSCRHIRTKS